MPAGIMNDNEHGQQQVVQAVTVNNGNDNVVQATGADQESDSVKFDPMSTPRKNNSDS